MFEWSHMQRQHSLRGEIVDAVGNADIDVFEDVGVVAVVVGAV